jgi:peptidyl-dipeptidase Dcp
MPQALVEKIERSETFNQGYRPSSTSRPPSSTWTCTRGPTVWWMPDAFERETLARIGMPPQIAMRHRLPQFNHLFASDAYSAGYYSYLWSEVMDADTWRAFEEAPGGPWDKELAARFRRYILSNGNVIDRAEAYRLFRGRDPDVRALLAQRGFPTE